MAWTILAAVIALIAGLAIGLVVRNAVVSKRMRAAESTADRLVADAELEAETKVETSLSEVKAEIAAMRREAEEDLRTRREEIIRSEDRLHRREESIETRAAELRTHQEQLEKVGQGLSRQKALLERAGEQQRAELERISMMTVSEAKEALLQLARKGRNARARS